MKKMGRSTWLRIAKELALPRDFVTQSAAILARKRSGKSYTARKIVEQLLRLGEQVIIVDPKGDWWGILSSANGKAPGFPITIFGGEHKHVPLEVRGGELVAKVAVEERASMLLDLSEFRKSEVAQFMADFLETLYRLKAKEANRSTVMLVVDEADAIAPQKPFPNETKMLGAIEDVVRRGGQRGLGCILVSQRSAVLNKNVLTQTQVMIALRTIAPQDIAAMEDWIKVHGDKERRDQMVSALPSLPIGEAWFWSPGWPDAEGIFKRVKVDPIETFDSGATPKPGEKKKRPKKLADVDLERIRHLMADVVARAQADDPKLLRARIAELEKTSKANERAVKLSEELRTQVPTIAPVDWKWLRRETDAAVGEFGTAMETALAKLDKRISDALCDSEVVHDGKKRHGRVASTQFDGSSIPKQPKPAARPKAHAPLKQSANVGATSSTPGGGLFRMMVALAQRQKGLTNAQLGVRAGISSRSGTFSTYLSKGRTEGWIRDEGEKRFITQDGIDALGDFNPLPEGAELLDYWVKKLGGGAARMLSSLAEAYPNAMTNEELGEAAGISSRSGTFSTYLSKLRTLELVDGGRGEIKMSEELA